MTYAQILDFVFDNGRITSSEEDWDEYIVEVENEVRGEASERLEAGELDGTVEECVKFALEHI